MKMKITEREKPFINSHIFIFSLRKYSVGGVGAFLGVCDSSGGQGTVCCEAFFDS